MIGVTKGNTTGILQVLHAHEYPNLWELWYHSMLESWRIRSISGRSFDYSSNLYPKPLNPKPYMIVASIFFETPAG